MTQRWLDGPRFVHWCELHGLRAVDIEPSGSTMAKWRKAGSLVGYYRADEILVRHGYHLTELPDDIWIRRSVRPWPKEVKEAAMKDYEDGVAIFAITERHGPRPDTILRWARDAKKVPA